MSGRESKREWEWVGEREEEERRGARGDLPGKMKRLRMAATSLGPGDKGAFTGNDNWP